MTQNAGISSLVTEVQILQPDCLYRVIYADIITCGAISEVSYWYIDLNCFSVTFVF